MHFSAYTGILFCQYWQQKVREASRSQVFFYQYCHFCSSCFFLSALAPGNTTDRDITDKVNIEYLDHIFSPICVHWLSKLPPFIRSVSEQNEDCKQRCQFCWQRWRSLALPVLPPILAEKRQYWQKCQKCARVTAALAIGESHEDLPSNVFLRLG